MAVQPKFPSYVAALGPVRSTPRTWQTCPSKPEDYITLVTSATLVMLHRNERTLQDTSQDLSWPYHLHASGLNVATPSQRLIRRRRCKRASTNASEVTSCRIDPIRNRSCPANVSPSFSDMPVSLCLAHLQILLDLGELLVGLFKLHIAVMVCRYTVLHRISAERLTSTL